MKRTIATLTLLLLATVAEAQLKTQGTVYDSAATHYNGEAGKTKLQGFGTKGFRVVDVDGVYWLYPPSADVGFNFKAGELLLGVLGGDSVGSLKGNRGGMTIADSAGHPTFWSPSKGLLLYEDWISSSENGVLGWTQTVTGDADATMSNTNVAANIPGVMRLTTGTSTNRAVLHLGASTTNATIKVDGTGIFMFQTTVYLPALSTASEEFDVYVGLMNTTAGGDPAEGLYFQYDRNTSTNWIIGASAASTATEVTSTKAVQAGAWMKLRIEVATLSNGATTTVVAEFFVNGSSAGGITTNLPTLAIAPAFKIDKSAFTAAASLLDVDYMVINYFFGTAR